MQGREAVATQNRDMDQHVGFAVVWNNEAITFGDVEPFDAPGDFNQTFRALDIRGLRRRNE